MPVWSCAPVHRLSRWAIAVVLWLAAGCWLGDARAQEAAQESPSASVERTQEGLLLTARVPAVLPAGLDDLLHKGVPLHFIWQAEVVRPRWYWVDHKVADVTRVVRIAYQPLTRRWRMSVTSALPTEAMPANALHQSVASLQEVLAVATRVSSWKLVEGESLDPEATYKVHWRLRLDAGPLPRVIQLGFGGSAEGSLDWEETLTVGPVPAVREP